MHEVPGDWTRLKQLAAEAIELDETGREVLLARVAADDPQRAAQLRRLLAASADDAFLTPPHMDDDEPHRLIGLRVGAYRVEALAGVGGMGHVYRAVRADGQYEGLAALKVLRHELLARPLLRRFAIERQALARLAHPNIARLLDAGALDDGRPWLLMEWIDGEPIDAWARRRGLTVRQRVALLVQAARAVQFAHERLVIHRDLKPSNMLVDAQGHVHLLDFGVAKLLDAPPPHGLTTRGSMARFLTPGYASPEQLADEPLSTASDVYSLGVILYELLTGRSPHPPIESRDHDRWHAALLAHDPPWPSSVVRRSDDPARRREARRLRGDLDNVVLTALRVEPRQRYQSAGELADDLEHFLSGRPVRATPQTWRYRTAKFVRRHRIGVATGIGAMAISAAAMAGVAYHAQAVSRQRDRAVAAQHEAEAARRSAQRVSTFLQDLLASARPDRDGGDVTVRQVLERAAGQLDTLRDQPQVEATLHTTIGSAYCAMGDYDAAEPHLLRALALRRAADPPDPITLGEALNNLAALRHAQGRFEQAARFVREAIEVQRRALNVSDPRMATSLNNLAAIERRLGNLDEAERLHRRVLSIRRQVLGEQHADVAQSLNNLAMVLIQREQLDEAAQALERALRIRERLFGRRHPEVAQSLYNLGVVEQRSGRFDQALKRYQAALAIEQEVFDGDHPAIATTLGRVGSVHLLRNDPAAAVRPLREALRISEHTLPPDDLRTQKHRLLLAQALAKTPGGRTEAATLLRAAEAALARTVGDGHPLSQAVRAELVRLAQSP